jgi:hypothetical protein
MVGVACAAPDVRDGGGGDVPSPFPEGGVCVLLHLRSGAQHRSGADLQSLPARFRHGRTAKRRSNRPAGMAPDF